METTLLTTYSLLGYLKENSISEGPIADLFVPIVKKALSEYAKEHHLSEYKGRSLAEIQDKIRLIFSIEIPISIIKVILSNIQKQINDEHQFVLYNDGAFIIKSYSFEDIDNIIEIEEYNIAKLQENYKQYCDENNYICNFDELQSFIISQQVELFSNKELHFSDINQQIPKYIQKVKDNSEIFNIIANIYLGSIVVSYMQLNITKKVTDAELLIDTNFFISLLDLNTEESYYTCSQLFNLCKQVGYRFTMLYSTVNQIKILLGNRISDFNNKNFIGSVRGADIFNACIRRNLDKTDLEKIRDSVNRELHQRGIVVIKEAQIPDIIKQAKLTSEYKELLKRRKNNEESALNDCVAKLYVQKNRGVCIQEFVDVKCWFLHNSHTNLYQEKEKEVHKRYSISANELLVLLWLACPAQSKNLDVRSIGKSGIISYVTRYRRSKTPSIDTLKHIASRAKKALASGILEETDVFNLCARMGEGSLSQEIVEQELNNNAIDDVQFAENFRKLASEYENENLLLKKQIKIQKEQYDNQIELQKTEIEELKTVVRQLKNNDYQRKKDEYITKGIRKARWVKVGICGIILLLAILNVINKHYDMYVSTPLAIIFSVILSVAPFLLPLFISSIEYSDLLFSSKRLKKRLEKDFEQMEQI